MKITNRNIRQEVPFGDISITEGFLYEDKPFLKVYLPNGNPAGVELATGKTIVIKATTFVYPIVLEVIYS